VEDESYIEQMLKDKTISGLAEWYSGELGGGRSRVRVPAGAENFSLHHRVQTGSGAHPASCPMGTRYQGAFSLGIKRPGFEADHSPPSSAAFKNALCYTSTPQYAFKAWCSVKAQGQVYLYRSKYKPKKEEEEEKNKKKKN
jgi:hypothetical protein